MITKALFELPGGGMLRADAAASYLRMRAAGMPAGGVQVFYRSLKKQAKLFHLHQLGLGPLAAKPTPNAPHVRGVAMDLRTGGSGAYHPSAAHLWLSHGGDGSTRPKPGEKLRSHAFGWRRSVPSERWHYGYDPARDHKRSTDLRARLKKVGFTDVAKFQAAHGLKPDGKDGPLTWKVLLTLTGVGNVPAADVALNFRFGHAAFAGQSAADVDDLARGRFLHDGLACSVYTLTGAPEQRRDALRKALGGPDAWLVYPIADTTVMWSAAKWVHHDRVGVAFGAAGSGGAVRARLSGRSSGRALDVIAVQSRPSDEFASPTDATDAQQVDLATAITQLHRPKVPTVVAGDLGSAQATDVLTKRGFVRVSGAAPQGDHPDHQVWASATVHLRQANGVADPAVDGRAWKLKLTLPKLNS